MPKDSDSLNQKDNSNSKMIAIAPATQVEEVLISDEEQAESEDPQPYEFRLNEKLRDLGLYEDGMTVQQKEELLAVVVASWQTAEEEKTRRQYYQEYLNASEAFCNDQMEFTFKESPECSSTTTLYNATQQYYDIPLPSGSPAESYSKDLESKALITNGDINPDLTYTSDIASDSSLDNYEDTNCASSSAIFTSSQSQSGVQTQQKGNVKRVRLKKETGLSIVESIQSSSANIESVIESQVLVQPKIEPDEQRTSLWAPCLSPKDISLSCQKRPWLNDPESPCDSGDEDYTSNIMDLVKDFDYARLTQIHSHSPDRTIAKPYHLNRRGIFSQRTTKPDQIDLLVGVATSINNDVPTFPNFTEAFCGTSDSSLQTVKTRTNDFEAMTTRSGLKYGLYCDQDNEPLASEAFQMLEGSEAVDDTLEETKWPTSLEEANLYSEVEVILDESLPKLSSLRPGLYGDGFALVEDVSGEVNSVQVHKFEGVTSEAKNHSASENAENVNHNAHSAYVDNNSSDGSSVIDVETVVDEEIEEFVLKRKMLHEYQFTEKEPKTSQSKRLKKTSL